MGLCVSKPQDYASVVVQPDGEMRVVRYLHGVKPGEDVEPRLDRVTGKLLNQIRQGGPISIGQPPRDLSQSFRY